MCAPTPGLHPRKLEARAICLGRLQTHPFRQPNAPNNPASPEETVRRHGMAGRHLVGQSLPANALAAANKRVANILTKVDEALPAIDQGLLSEPAEVALHRALTESQAALDAAVANNDYPKALSNLAKLREPVDAFFDNVLVNADDASVRLNRLGLLKELRGQFLKVADLAVLAR